MSDQASANIAQEEERATEETADENVRELRKEYGENADNSDDEVVRPPSKPEGASTNPANQSKEHVQKEPPRMNIQLQH